MEVVDWFPLGTGSILHKPGCVDFFFKSVDNWSVMAFLEFTAAASINSINSISAPAKSALGRNYLDLQVCYKHPIAASSETPVLSDCTLSSSIN